MSKRLIAVLAFALVAGLIGCAYAEVQNVKVSGDLTVYGVEKSDFALQNHSALKERSDMLSITRVRVDADLTDNVMATVRLINERYWGSQEETVSNTDIDLDLAYATLKEFLYSPLTLMVGRQELHYGNEMIIGDVDTNNQVSTASAIGSEASLSKRKAFDAVRAVLNYDPLVIDIVGSKIRERVLNNNDDQDLYGINAAYQINKSTVAEGYYWLKNSQKKANQANTAAAGHSKGDNTQVIGGRIGKTMEKKDVMLTSNLEAAYQFGHYNDGVNRISARRAFAVEAAQTFGFTKVKYTPALTVLGAWFSGKHDPNVTTEQNRHMTGWDPMFENQSFGDIANQAFDQTNARIAGAIATIKPKDDISLKGEYYAFWWDRPYNVGAVATARTGYSMIMTDKRFAGQEVDLTATYDYTEDVQFALMGGVLLPGKAFAKDTPTAQGYQNMASEVVGSMKVTF